MIQFIVMLLGLAFPNNTNNAIASNNIAIITAQSSISNSGESTEDTSGDNGQLPPKK